MKLLFVAALFSPTAAFTVRQASSRSTRLYSDGNPPPFDNWGTPPATPPAPAPAPATPDYSSWGQPAAPAPAPATPDFSSWGQPAAPASPATADSWGQPAAAAPPAPEATQAASSATPVSPSAEVSSGDPVSVLDASQQSSFSAIAATIPDLVAKPDLSWQGESIAGYTATLEGWDAPGSANVAWLGNLCIDGKLSSLTIFNGPLTDVPHLLSRCLVTDDNKLEVAVSIRPRAYGAYELRDDAGNYPGPEELGRKAFEYSGARNEFFNKYGTDQVQALLDPAQFEGATALEQTELDRLTGGPLDLFLTMPMTDSNLAKVVAMREHLADSWLEWALMDGNQHRPGAPVNTQYVYDSKFRQNAYSALLPYYSKVFGPADGAKLAAAESGPLDEAYVGGGS